MQLYTILDEHTKISSSSTILIFNRSEFSRGWEKMTNCKVSEVMRIMWEIQVMAGLENR